MVTLIERFAAEHFKLNQISEKRQGDVLSTLTMFEGWMSPRAIETVEADDVRTWMTELLEAGRNASTVKWRLNCLKPFFRWMRQAKAIDAERWIELNEVKPPRGSTNGDPKPYTRKELDAFWRALDERYPRTTDYYLRRFTKGTSKLLRVRSHCQHAQVEAIAKLALYCGLRRTEIFHLTIDEMHPDNAYLVVHGKREDHRPKVREVPYSTNAREAVIEWFRCRRMLAPLHDSPWVNLGGARHELEPMDLGSLAHMFGQFGNGYALHRFRHTCATERLRQRMPLEELRDFLGHADIQQTLGYAKLLRDDIAASIDQTEAAFDRAVGRRKAA